MRLQAVELIRVRLPLVAPFRTSFGTQAERDILLVRALTDTGEGWGECVALAEPSYSSEWVDGAQQVIERFLLPPLLAAPELDAVAVAGLTAGVVGNRMAKAAVEMAVLDAELRASGVSFAGHLGAVRDAVDCGVSVGIHESPRDLVATVAGYLEDGYRRIKLKIEPGLDVDHVRAVRAAFPDVPLQVDANSAYRPEDAEHLARLDEFGLLLIEQPFPEERLLDHAHLARRVRTPICLDESIVSAAVARDAIELGACSVINIKPGRVGGYLEARRIHDLALAAGVPVWMGGMLETGLGRAGNVAMAAMAGFTLPGDTSASDRYFERDLTEPFVLEDGRLRVPEGPGLGRTPVPEVLEQVLTSRRLLVGEPR